MASAAKHASEVCKNISFAVLIVSRVRCRPREDERTHLLFCVQGQANTARRDELLRYQKEAQERWQQDKLFEVDAPAEGKIM